MSATVDVPAQLAAWRNETTSWSDGLALLMASKTRARIELFDGEQLINGPEFALDALFPCFDRLHDGRWVVANARCWVNEENASIIAPNGEVLSRVCLGDAIAHLQCDGTDGIWVSYTDEGAGGIIRFRADGTATRSPEQTLEIFDCYAMNVGGDGVWLYYYTEFPIAHVPFDGRPRVWTNETVAGASIIAVEDDLVLLSGGYEEEADAGALLRLDEDGHAELLHRFRLDAELTSALCNGQAFARGRDVHFVDSNAWTVISVRDFMNRLTP